MRFPRVALLCFGILVTGLGANAAVMNPIPGDPVMTDAGRVSGTLLDSGIRGYFGIPFAAPPVRENRWREPQPVAAWRGIYNADKKPAECVQGLRSNNINHYFGDEDAAEDCLYLNIWTPATAHAGAKLPVVVWIYGGGFSGGSASMAVYGGENLAKKGVVYVAINYRLGVFGFMAHPEATKESGHNASGNWGFLDQVAALKWVNRNIAAFGGDPGNVMIAGQSAGSMSVNDLQASPLAKGLFERAFGQSGATVDGGGLSMSDSEAQGEAEGLKLQAAMKVKSLAEMRTFSSDKVQAIAQQNRIRTGPVVDGYYLPKSPEEIFRAGQQNDVVIIVGSTANDLGTDLPIRKATTVAEYQAAAQQMFGDRAKEFLALYPAKTDAQVHAAAEQASEEYGLGLGVRNWARYQTQTGKQPAYLYLYSRVQPYAPGVTFADHDPKTAGAYHMSDTPYWLQTQDAFNMFRTTRNWTPYDRDLADKMSDIFVNFAKIGDPSAPGVKLLKYDPRREQRVEFGDSIHVVTMNTNGMDFLTVTPVVPRPRPAQTANTTPSSPTF